MKIDSTSPYSRVSAPLPVELLYNQPGEAFYKMGSPPVLASTPQNGSPYTPASCSTHRISHVRPRAIQCRGSRSDICLAPSSRDPRRTAVPNISRLRLNGSSRRLRPPLLLPNRHGRETQLIQCLGRLDPSSLVVARRYKYQLGVDPCFSASWALFPEFQIRLINYKTFRILDLGVFPAHHDSVFRAART